MELIELEGVYVHPRALEADRDTLIEAPPGFKWLALKIAESTGAVVSARPIWGSCDVKLDERYRRIFHLGHGVPPNVAHLLRLNLGAVLEEQGQDLYLLRAGDREVHFIPVYYRPPERLPRPLEDGKLYYPLPYRLIAERIAAEAGLPLARRPITGCWVGEPPGEVANVVASGSFYPLTLKLFYPSARVYRLDPFRGVVEDVEAEFARAMRLKARAHLADRSRAVVLVSAKPGQRQDARAAELAARLGARVVVVDEAAPELIDDLGVSLVVNTACPRIGIDDLDRIRTPVLNHRELEGLDPTKAASLL